LWTLSSLPSQLWHCNGCLWPKYDCNVVLDLLQGNDMITFFNNMETIHRGLTTRKTTREESQMSNFHTTLFQNSFVSIGVLNWFTIILVPLWSIINIFLIFLFLFVIIFTYLQFLTEFAGFEISFHVVYMWTSHVRSDWSNWPIKSLVGIWYALTCKQHGSWFRLPRPLIIEDPTVTDSSVPFTFLCLSQTRT